MKLRILFLLLFFMLKSYASTPPSIVYQYRIFCITENQNVYEWNTVAPSTCPNNTALIILRILLIPIVFLS